MNIPNIRLVAFEDRTSDLIFVGIPDSRGRYLRTDKSVVFAICPRCHAAIGEPCKSRSGDGYSGTTHSDRRIAAQRSHRGIKADDVLSIVLDASGREAL